MFCYLIDVHKKFFRTFSNIGQEVNKNLILQIRFLYKDSTHLKNIFQFNWNSIYVKAKMKIAASSIILFLATVADAGVSMNNPFYCYSTDVIRPQVQMHSTRSSYEAVRRTSVNPTASCKNKNIFLFSLLLSQHHNIIKPFPVACNPSRFWFLSRHGGRFPHPVELQDMFDFADSSVGYFVS